MPSVTLDGDILTDLNEAAAVFIRHIRGVASTMRPDFDGLDNMNQAHFLLLVAVQTILTPEAVEHQELDVEVSMHAVGVGLGARSSMVDEQEAIQLMMVLGRGFFSGRQGANGDNFPTGGNC